MADMLREGRVKPGSPTRRFSSLRQTASRLLPEIAGTTGAAWAPPPSAPVSSPTRAERVIAAEHGGVRRSCERSSTWRSPNAAGSTLGRRGADARG